MTWLSHWLTAYWPILLTAGLFATLTLILTYLDHHDGGHT